MTIKTKALSDSWQKTFVIRDRRQNKFMRRISLCEAVTTNFHPPDVCDEGVVRK